MLGCQPPFFLRSSIPGRGWMCNLGQATLLREPGGLQRGSQSRGYSCSELLMHHKRIMMRETIALLVIPDTCLRAHTAARSNRESVAAL